MDAKRAAAGPLSSPAAAQRCAKGAGLDSGAAAAAQSAMPSIARLPLHRFRRLSHQRRCTGGASASLVNLHQLDGRDHLLRSGRLPWGAGCADNECPVDALFDSYVQHANRQGARRRSIETAIGSLLKKTFPTLRRVRATGSRGDDRVYVYQFPPLAQCRKRFDELMQGSIDWGSSGRGFFDIDEWEKEPPPDR
jgi:hypothetical protein